MPIVPAVPPYPSKEVGEDLAAAAKEWNQLVAGQAEELAEWWVRRMAAVYEPIHEKLTLIWHNHFATSAAKVQYSTYMGHELLVHTIGTDPVPAVGPGRRDIGFPA